MVRSSISEAERRAWNRVLGLAFVGTVGGSAGLMGLANGASLAVTAGLVGFGLLAGAVLLWYVSQLSMGTRTGRDHRER